MPTHAGGAGSGLVRSFLHLGAGQVATTILTIVLSAAIARTLGPAEFGLLYVVTSIATFAYVFVDWGHAAYVTREVARRPERSGELLGTVNVLRGAAALAVCVPVVAITWLLGYDRRTIVYAVVLIAAWLPSFFATSHCWIFRGHERMDYDAQVNVAMRLLSLVISIVCLALGGRVLGLILISLISGGITLMLAGWMYHRLRLPALTVRWATARELLHGGAPLLAMAVAVAIQPYINANILYKLTTPTAVGWYGVAWNIAGTLVAPSAILGTALYPRFSKVAGDTRALQRAVRASFRPLILIAVLGSVGTYLFADVAIEVIYSTEKFAGAPAILRAFAPALLLLYLDMLFGAASFALDRTGPLALFKVIAVVVTSGAALFLVPWYQAQLGNGGIGVMYAVAAGEAVMVSATVALAKEALDRRMVLDLLRGAVVGGVTIALMRVLPAMSPVVAIPLCVALFMTVAAVFGMVTRADADLLVGSLRRTPPPDPVPGELLGVAKDASAEATELPKS